MVTVGFPNDSRLAMFALAAGSLSLLTMAGLTQAVGKAADTSISDAGVRFFENKVRPLLFENCLPCHGDTKQMGGLRLDSALGVRKGGGRGPIIVASDPEKSRLIQVIRYHGDLKMPPAGKLSDGQIATLTEWVRKGAAWPEIPSAAVASSTPDMLFTPAQRKFWSFQPVMRPPMPILKRSRTFSGNPIDAFLQTELEKKGIAPAPLADKRTLIRRATFDLIGLPPTPSEVSAFLHDPSPDAYARVIDRLLASPRYGERWGRHWLDLVRYCDSLDSRSLGAPGDIGEAWRYRDWVVNAFNRDLPYNEFVMDQIAGDLRPARKLDEFNRGGLIATTMLAIGNWGNGDADKEKIYTDIVDDQIDLISRTFMGLTVGCARCHNHKFDPISQKDYYGLAGIFFSTHILAKFTPKGAGEDIMRTPLASRDELEARKKHAARIAELEQNIKTADDDRRRSVAQSLRPESAKYLAAAADFHALSTSKQAPPITEFARQRGLREYALRQWMDFAGLGGFRVMSTPVRDLLSSPGIYAWKGAADTPSATVNTTADPKTLLTFTLPPHSVCVHPGPQFGVAVAWHSPVNGAVRIDGGVKDADAACGDGILWKLQIVTSTGATDILSGAIDNGGSQPFRQVRPEPLDQVSVRRGDTIQLLVLPKNGHECDTTVVTLTLQELGGSRKWDLSADMMDDPLSGNPHKDRLGNPGIWSFLDMATGGPADLKEPLRTAVNSWRRTVAEPSATTAERDAAAGEVASAFDLADSRSPFWPANAADLAEFPNPQRDAVAQMSQELDSLRKKTFPPLEYANAAQDGGIPETPYEGFHDAKVHLRGNYARLADLVPRRFPTILSGGTAPLIRTGSGRLELAEWIASERHPLTARVMVNRIWQHHFGEGIVRTPSNYGFLGERPTNAALLDWLASEFVRTGWSVKKMHKLIMLSDAYRRSAEPTQSAIRLDPDNRLFSRQNRRRLEAEAIRDSLLAVSGKLDDKMGGPAVRDFNMPRRTLYVITIRSDRTGFGPLFDAADTTALVDRRTVSIVAPQSLFLMNNPFVLGQAKSLAVRLLREASKAEDARIQSAYELLFGRSATAPEVAVGRRLLANARKGRPEKLAGDAVPDAEMQAWEAYCQVLLCSNEFLFVD